MTQFQFSQCSKGLFILMCLLLFFSEAYSQNEWSAPVWIDVMNGLHAIEPSISADEKKLYFAHAAKIWVATWQDSGWGNPQLLNDNINAKNNGRDIITDAPFITADGRKLYFRAWARPGGVGGYDFWVSEWDGTDWGPAKNVGPPVNSPGLEWDIALTADQKQLFFTRDYPPFDTDVFVSTWTDSGWGEPERLPEGPANVNWGSPDDGVAISADGSELFLATWRDDGAYDIYVTRKDSAGNWQDIEKLSNINVPADSLDFGHSTGWDYTPALSYDGTKLFFASRRDKETKPTSIWMTTRTITHVKNPPLQPPGSLLLQKNYPNPFNAETLISYHIPEAELVKLAIFDLLGKQIRVLVDELQPAGFHQANWDGKTAEGGDAPSGIYLYVLYFGNQQQVGKMLLLR